MLSYGEQLTPTFENKQKGKKQISQNITAAATSSGQNNAQKVGVKQKNLNFGEISSLQKTKVENSSWAQPGPSTSTVKIIASPKKVN